MACHRTTPSTGPAPAAEACSGCVVHSFAAVWIPAAGSLPACIMPGPFQALLPAASSSIGICAPVWLHDMLSVKAMWAPTVGFVSCFRLM